MFLFAISNPSPTFVSVQPLSFESCKIIFVIFNSSPPFASVPSLTFKSFEIISMISNPSPPFVSVPPLLFKTYQKSDALSVSEGGEIVAPLVADCGGGFLHG